MLSRTADNLFWVSRYLERADFLARIIQTSRRIAALPKAYMSAQNEWESVLIASGADETFYDHFKTADEQSVIAYLAFDRRNPSSIANCIEYGRANARAVRTALTVEMWESINSAWLEMKKFASAHENMGRIDREELSGFLDFVKTTSLLFDGSAYRTMLRNDAYYFSRLGVYIERADNTARVLDVKYHVLLPAQEAVGGSLDYFQWTAILRAVSALTAYHWVYRESVKPLHVADLLILRPEMPRSLLSCYDNIVHFLDAIAKQYGRQGPSQRHGRNIRARLANASINDIFQSGLHQFIEAFVSDNSQLGADIAEQYLLG